MTDISNATHVPGGRLSAYRTPAARRVSIDANQTQATQRPTDQVELSSEARQSIRTDLVERVKREIAEGTYLTNEKLEAAIDGLGRDLGIEG